MRTHGIDRWNWSEKANKWVFVSLKDGQRVYKYQENPPEEFLELIRRIRILNKKLITEIDECKNAQIYKELMITSQKMQAMRS